MANHKIRTILVNGNTAHIPLTRGLESIIDVADIDTVSAYTWIAKSSRNAFYATTSVNDASGRKGTLWLHRLIMDAPDGLQVDHINGNGLDNRRSNLRLATQSQNQHNATIRADNTSGFKGVSWHQAQGKWRARIMLEGKPIFLGWFSTPEEAHAAYCRASQDLHGAFANFG